MSSYLLKAVIALFCYAEADNQIIIGCSITENADEFAADLVSNRGDVAWYHSLCQMLNCYVDV